MATWVEIKGSRETVEDLKTMTLIRLGVSSDGTGAPAVGDMYAAESAPIGRKCIKIKVMPEVIPGIYLHTSQYLGFSMYAGLQKTQTSSLTSTATDTATDTLTKTLTKSNTNTDTLTVTVGGPPTLTKTLTKTDTNTDTLTKTTSKTVTATQTQTDTMTTTS